MNVTIRALDPYVKKAIADGKDIPFGITVKEYAVAPKGQHLRFFAQADRPVNQGAAGFVPSGWGDSVLKALADCMRLIRQFPCEE